MYGKMTTSRMGIIGRRFVSDFSFEVSIELPSGFPLPYGYGSVSDAVGGAVQWDSGETNRPFPIL
jgi:hypothetical protein